MLVRRNAKLGTSFFVKLDMIWISMLSFINTGLLSKQNILPGNVRSQCRYTSSKEGEAATKTSLPIIESVCDVTLSHGQHTCMWYTSDPFQSSLCLGWYTCHHIWRSYEHQQYILALRLYGPPRNKVKYRSHSFSKMLLPHGPYCPAPSYLHNSQ